MFTNELMEQKYAQTHDIIKVFEVLFQSVFLADNEFYGDCNKIITNVQLQKANNIWKLFASRHTEVKTDGFKIIFLKVFPEKTDYVNSILK